MVEGALQLFFIPGPESRPQLPHGVDDGDDVDVGDDSDDVDVGDDRSIGAIPYPWTVIMAPSHHTGLMMVMMD